MNRVLVTICCALLIAVNVAGDFGTSPPSGAPNNACYSREIENLWNAANATTSVQQSLSYGAAQAFDRLAVLGVNC